MQVAENQATKMLTMMSLSGVIRYFQLFYFTITKSKNLNIVALSVMSLPYKYSS